MTYFFYNKYNKVGDNMNKIIEALNSLMDELDNSETIKNLEFYKKKMKEDKKLESQIIDFNKKKENKNEEFQNIKISLYNNEIPPDLELKFHEFPRPICLNRDLGFSLIKTPTLSIFEFEKFDKKEKEEHEKHQS